MKLVAALRMQLYIIVGCLIISFSTIRAGEVLANDIVIHDVAVVDVIGMKVLSSQEIVIKDGKIVSVQDQPKPQSSGKTIIDGSSLIAIPGFINTHTHLWQHLAKGFHPSGNLQEWVKQIYKFAHYLERDELYNATLAATSEGLLSGITTVADFASVNFSDFSLEATCSALNETTMGGIVVYWNPSAFIPHRIKEKEIAALKDRYKKLNLWMGHGPLSFFAISSVYDAISIAKKLNLSMTEHTMENVQEQREFHARLKNYLDKYDTRLKLEVKSKLQEILGKGVPSNVDGVVWLQRLSQEILEYDKKRNRLTQEEKENLSKWIGKKSISPVPLLNYMGAFDNRYISIHSVWQTQSDMDIYKSNNVTISHNPESNMYLSSGIAPILKYKSNDILVSLATDGAASNDGINFFSAMRGLWNLQKIETLDTEISNKIDSWYVMQVATINGATAMGLEDRIGSVEKGKEADIALLSRERLKISPYVPGVNVIPLLVYSGTPSAVDTVISDGKIVVKDREIVYGKGVPELAMTLSNISNTVNKRHQKGKEWSETFDLSYDEIDSYWYRFRSVRKKDKIDITIRNKGAKDLNIYLAMSGEPFGGTASAMLSPETMKTFPSDPVPKFWEKEVTLKPDKSLQVKKNRGAYDYEISIPDILIKRVGRPEQVLFLIEK